METKPAQAEVVEDGRSRDRRGRVKVKAERREELVAEYRHSGLSQAEFARRACVNYQTFAHWGPARPPRSSRGGPARHAGDAAVCRATLTRGSAAVAADRGRRVERKLARRCRGARRRARGGGGLGAGLARRPPTLSDGPADPRSAGAGRPVFISCSSRWTCASNTTACGRSRRCTCGSIRSRSRSSVFTNKTRTGSSSALGRHWGVGAGEAAKKAASRGRVGERRCAQLTLTPAALTMLLAGIDLKNGCEKAWYER